MKKAAEELFSIIEALVSSWPGFLGEFFRNYYFTKRLKYLGKNSTINKFFEIVSPTNISIGENSSIGSYSFLCADGGEIQIGNHVSFNRNVHLNASIGGKITIEDYCLIGPNVVFRTANHNFHSITEPIRNQGHSVGIIHLEKNVWIGSNVVILKDVKIGEGSIIAAGSVVTRNIPAFVIAGGVPAKVISKRK